MYFAVCYVLCAITRYVMCTHRSFPLCISLLILLHSNCTSLACVVASEHYLYFVLPYASYRILCILVYLSYALRDEAPYVRLLMHWLLLYGKCCHTQVRPFGFMQMQQGSAQVLDQTQHIVNLKLYDNSCHLLGPTVMGLACVNVTPTSTPRRCEGEMLYFHHSCNCPRNFFKKFLPLC